MSECGSKGCGCDAVATRAREPSAVGAGSMRLRYRIENMNCPTEEALIRGKRAGVAGVTTLEFNLVQRTLQVGHAADTMPRVLAALKALGFDAEVRNAATSPKPRHRSPRARTGGAHG